MTHVLVTGGAGGLGSELIPRLVRAGHVVRGTSRRDNPGYTEVEWIRSDLMSGEGLHEAVQGVGVVIHAASSPSQDTWRTDVEGTARLLDSCRAAGVSHIIYVSIVGIDRIPSDYYKAKLAAEQHIMAGGVPWTIQRATQFFSLVDEVIRRAARYPVLFLPTDFKGQPIDIGEAADLYVDLVRRGPSGRVPDAGGPQIRQLGEMTRQWLTVRGVKKPLVHLPLPGGFAAGFRAGYNTAPDNKAGRLTWEDWLRRA